MASEGLKMRHPVASVPSTIKPESRLDEKAEQNPTAAQLKEQSGILARHGSWALALRAVLLLVYFFGSVFVIALTQFLGAPLYFYSKDLFYAWMAMTKQQFSLLVIAVTEWWAPVKMRVSGDESVRGQLRRTEDGRLETDFPERMVLVSNHQIYTDWVYLWWIAYASRMHGHLYIILKESIKYIPILGTGMMFFGFVFLSRKWASDQKRFQHRLRKLSTSHKGPLSGTSYLDPMWLLIFPEGTNLSKNGRESSRKWAEKNGIPDLRHALLPRSTGLAFCLQELDKSIDYMYDCTVAYEGVPRGQYGQDLISLRSTYFQGRSPKSVNMHWRRWAISSMPIHDEKLFADWLLARWREKDDLIEYYLNNGRFPADKGVTTTTVDGVEVVKRGAGWIETEVRPKNIFDVVGIFVPLAAFALVVNVVLKVVDMALRTLRIR